MPWPAAICHGCNGLLPKPGADKWAPLFVRVLTVLATLYRSWARARLADVEDWTASWLTPELYAGGGGAA
eukprot:6883541-Alexandrium_andersonii.AAC.1